MKNSEWIGKNVIVRNLVVGVLFGTVVRRTRDSITLREGGRIYRWSGALCVESIAARGCSSDRLVKFGLQAIARHHGEQVIEATDEAMARLRGIPEYRS